MTLTEDNWLAEQQNANRIDKAWAVVNSCETPQQAASALRYLKLLADRHNVDISDMRRELVALFDLRWG